MAKSWEINMEEPMKKTEFASMDKTTDGVSVKKVEFQDTYKNLGDIEQDPALQRMFQAQAEEAKNGRR